MAATATAAAVAAVVDTVPISLIDQHRPIPNIRTRTFFIVKARLDADAMKTALDTLIREHWRKLGGRIVLNNATDMFEYRVPHTFPPADTYELFRWSTETKAASIDAAAPALMQTPPLETSEGGGGIAFLPSVNSYDDEFRPASWPYNYDESPKDAPILFLHLSLYEDATVLAISLPHIVGDQLGTASLVRAWMAVLAGQAPEPLMEEDPLPQGREFSSLTKEEARKKGKMHVRRTGEYGLVILGFLPDMVFNAEEAHHILFLPMATVKALRARITKALNSNGNGDGNGNGKGGDPGVSDNDVITAVLTKLARAHKGPTTLTLTQSVNLRGRVPKLTGSAVEGFLHNGVTHASSRFHLDKNTPLAEIAKNNRNAILEMLEPATTDVRLAIAREMVRRKQSMHICEPFEKSYSVTSWPAAWKDLDFSPAVVSASAATATATATAAESSASSSSTQAPQQPPALFVLGRGGERATPHRYHSTIMFRNDAGYWCDIGGTKKNMAAIKAYLAQDPKLEKL